MNNLNLKRKHRFLICCGLFLGVVALLIIVTVSGSGRYETATNHTEPSTETPTQAPTEGSNKHIIENVKVIPQRELLAGCETYACTMLLQHLGYDISEVEFAENYLITKPISYDYASNRYGPDMNSAQAGDVYTGYGIYSPAMAKSMNSYLDTTGTGKKAYTVNGTPLEQLCEEYIDNGIPVMVWATTWMYEPYDAQSWIVDYVDENAQYAIGETFTWKQHEHCLVLIGYDNSDYYFADSCEGDIDHFSKELCQLRYEQIGTMAIVVK